MESRNLPVSAAYLCPCFPTQLRLLRSRRRLGARFTLYTIPLIGIVGNKSSENQLAVFR
jgi:hypothetical protein